MIAILGLSDAGKSTWLGSLLDTLEDREEGPLRLKKQQANFALLDAYRQALLDGGYPEHTKIDDDLHTRFELLWREKPVDVDISDYSGERISRLHRRHSHAWDAGWEARARCGRLAILLRADSITRLERGAARSAPAARFDRDLVPDDDDDDDESRRHPPTALALVEALQAMRAWRELGLGERGERGAERVAVILTAWDKLADRDPRPFLDANAPLLASWLDTNRHPEDLAVYGLSATGGDLGNDAHRSLVRKQGLASVAWCATGSPAQRRSDISLPLQWLLDGT